MPEKKTYRLLSLALLQCCRFSQLVFLTKGSAQLGRTIDGLVIELTALVAMKLRMDRVTLRAIAYAAVQVCTVIGVYLLHTDALL
jgi:hypothetical protein